MTAEDSDGRTVLADVRRDSDRAGHGVVPAPQLRDTLRQGFVRVLNHSDVAGEASIAPTDDAGVAYEPLTLALGPRPGRLGTSTPATWSPGKHGPGADRRDRSPAPAAGGSPSSRRTLDVEALAYVRTDDGFLAGMNGRRPASEGRDACDPHLQPGEQRRPGEPPAAGEPGRRGGRGHGDGHRRRGPVAGFAGGPDAAGRNRPAWWTPRSSSRGTGPRVRSPAGTALGDGAGKWRLAVESDKPLVAMSLLSSPGRATSPTCPTRRRRTGRTCGTCTCSRPPSRPAGDGRASCARSTAGATAARPPSLAYDDSDTRYDALRLSLDAGAGRRTSTPTTWNSATGRRA